MNQIANNIKRMLQAESDKGKNIDWLKELLFENVDHPFLKHQYESCPLLFESITDTERQLLACVGQLPKMNQFPHLMAQASLAASDVGVIPSIKNNYLLGIDDIYGANTNLLHESILNYQDPIAGKSPHAILYEFMRPNISQFDYNYIANNAKTLGNIATLLTQALGESRLTFRDPILAPSLFYDRVVQRLESKQPVDREMAMSPGGEGAIAGIESITKLPTWGEPHMWIEFPAYAEYKLPWEDYRLILAPRTIPWQLLLTTSEGYMVPVCRPIPIPLLDDTVWVAKFQSVHESPTKLIIPDQTFMRHVIESAQHLAHLAAIYSALASLKKIGRGNTRMRWINSPYNARLMSHIIKAIA